MSNPLSMRSITSISDFNLDEIHTILQTAKHLKKTPSKDLLKGKILASCFFEPSTRTRLSFESAMIRLGGNVLGFSEPNTTSSKKGETLTDSMRIISSYADVIILRHPKEGAARAACLASPIPIINAGDGSNQHPSQTLLDLFSILECQGTLENLRIAIVGDLLYGRTAHSLAVACALFNARLYFISPPSLQMPDDICEILQRSRTKFSFHPTIEEILPKVDILYMTRLQKERLNLNVHQELKNPYILNAKMLKNAKKNLKILHPLPRVGEIATDVDEMPHAYYFQQAQNGLFVRQALLSHVLKPKNWRGLSITPP